MYYYVNEKIGSSIESAKANALEPRAYLTYLFEQLPMAKTPEAIAALLPQNLNAEDLKLEPIDSNS
jgi:transposase